MRTKSDSERRLSRAETRTFNEAIRRGNVYKPTNKIAIAIRDAVAAAPKVLLTATPLQNSLLELFGLVSVIDEHTFGDLKSFRERFSRVSSDADHAIVQEFYPNEDEQRLYDLVSEYLQRPTLYALPAGQRQLMTLILRKLIGSSTYPISGTLDGLVKKLELAEAQATAVDAPPENLADEWDTLDDLADEWEDEGPEDGGKPMLTAAQLVALREETTQLREFHALAKSIIKNSKGDVLLTALRKGFAEAHRLSGGAAQPKAVIFTESRRTQEYLQRVLEQAEFTGKVTLFNGTNTDAASRAIYKAGRSSKR